MDKDLFTEIRVKYNILSKNQKIVANYILENRDSCVRMTLSELGKECGLSETTIIRFINKLDYTSYQDFKLDMAKNISINQFSTSSSGKKDYQEINADDTIEEVKDKVVSIVASAITDVSKVIPLEELEKAAMMIARANKIVFFGSGGSGVVAADGYHKFLRLGKNVINETNSHIALIYSSHLTSEDLLVLISHKGASKDVLECARIGKERGAKILVLTSYMNSELAKFGDYCLFSSTNDSPYYTEAMVSRLVQLVIMDMLFIVVSTNIDAEKAEKAMENSRLATREMKVKAEDLKG